MTHDGSAKCVAINVPRRTQQDPRKYTWRRQRSQPQCRPGSTATKPSGPVAKLDPLEHLQPPSAPLYYTQGGGGAGGFRPCSPSDRAAGPGPMAICMAMGNRRLPSAGAAAAASSQTAWWVRARGDSASSPKTKRVRTYAVLSVSQQGEFKNALRPPPPPSPPMSKALYLCI
jgi:hypothetical protein